MSFFCIFSSIKVHVYLFLKRKAFSVNDDPLSVLNKGKLVFVIKETDDYTRNCTALYVK